jgi:hypothetical protein
MNRYQNKKMILAYLWRKNSHVHFIGSIRPQLNKNRLISLWHNKSAEKFGGSASSIHRHVDWLTLHHSKHRESSDVTSVSGLTCTSVHPAVWLLKARFTAFQTP